MAIDGKSIKVKIFGSEYPLRREALHFGTTRGVSNTLLGETATVELEQGMLMCVLIHGSDTPE